MPEDARWNVADTYLIVLRCPESVEAAKLPVLEPKRFHKKPPVGRAGFDLFVEFDVHKILHFALMHCFFGVDRLDLAVSPLGGAGEDRVIAVLGH